MVANTVANRSKQVPVWLSSLCRGFTEGLPKGFGEDFTEGLPERFQLSGCCRQARKVRNGKTFGSTFVRGAFNGAWVCFGRKHNGCSSLLGFLRNLRINSFIEVLNQFGSKLLLPPTSTSARNLANLGRFIFLPHKHGPFVYQLRERAAWL